MRKFIRNLLFVGIITAVFSFVINEYKLNEDGVIYFFVAYIMICLLWFVGWFFNAVFGVKFLEYLLFLGITAVFSFVNNEYKLNEYGVIYFFVAYIMICVFWFIEWFFNAIFGIKFPKNPLFLGIIAVFSFVINEYKLNEDWVGYFFVTYITICVFWFIGWFLNAIFGIKCPNCGKDTYDTLSEKETDRWLGTKKIEENDKERTLNTTFIKITTEYKCKACDNIWTRTRQEEK